MLKSIEFYSTKKMRVGTAGRSFCEVPKALFSSNTNFEITQIDKRSILCSLVRHYSREQYTWKDAIILTYRVVYL